MIYVINLDGCDATTRFRTELTESEAILLKRISDMSKKTSTYGCMPTMTVKPEDPPIFTEWFTKEEYDVEVPLYDNQNL